MTATLDLPITGMTCANCANTISRVLKKTPGVEDANVNYAGEQAQVTYDPAQVKPAELIDRVRKAGYGVTTAHAELPVLGMTCANCANTIERALRKLPGMSQASVNYASESASINYVPGAVGLADVVGAIRKAGYDVPSGGSTAAAMPGGDAVAQARAAEIEDRRKRMSFGLAFAIPAFLISMSNDFGVMVPAVTRVLQSLDAWWLLTGWLHLAEHEMHTFHLGLGWTVFTLSLPVMLYTARPYFVHGYNALRNGMANMDVLVALGSGIAFLYSLLVLLGVFGGHVYFETAAVIVALISVGKYLEARAKGRTSEAIKRLMSLAPKTATVLRRKGDGSREQVEAEVPITQISIGDVIVARPGERIATDGIVVEGRSAVDESMLTGESVPRDKKPGDAVIGATLNKEGLLKFEASKIGKDTALANIVRLVQQAQGSKAPIQALADKVSAIFVPVILAVAALTFLGWWLFMRAPLETALVNAISVLVIACPCALGLATPTAIMVGMGRSADFGILFKNSAALERAATIKTVVFDKTGTITSGEPAVTDVLALAEGVTPEQVLQLAAGVERGSEHPLAKAVLRHADATGARPIAADRYLAVPGKGMTAYIDAHQASVGSRALMQMHGVAIHDEAASRVDALQAQGKTIMWVGRNTRLLGALALSDTLKDGARDAMSMLTAIGITPIMLTGDNARAATAIALQAGIGQAIADVLPGEKAAKIAQLQSMPAAGTVAMVGDGINDAPALAQADVGLAMGTGTDIAMETADVTLINGDIRNVARAVGLSKLTVRGIRQNLFWAFIYNVLLIPLAIAGVFANYGPILAAGAMAFSSLFVVSNSLRLRTARV